MTLHDEIERALPWAQPYQVRAIAAWLDGRRCEGCAALAETVRELRLTIQMAKDAGALLPPHGRSWAEIGRMSEDGP